MEPERDEHRHRETSRSRRSRHSHRSKRNRPDNESVDSGYGGSSAASSPQSPQRGLPRGQQTVPPLHVPRRGPPSPAVSRQLDQDAEKRSEGPGKDSESDSDYDPRSKYYIGVDDDAYWDVPSHGAAEEDTKEQDQSNKSRGKRRQPEDDYPATRPEPRRDHGRRRRPSHRDRSYSKSSGESGDSASRRHDSQSRKTAPRRHPDTARPRRDSYRSQRSPVRSEPAGERPTSPPGRRRRSRTRSRSRVRDRRRRRRGSAAARTPGSEEDTDPEREGRRRDRHRRASPGPGRGRGGTGRSASSRDGGAADMDDAWYRTLKERLTKGVDLGQVKKVGLDAAAVAAVKVAVGTQVPWRQRIPKTIAVGLAAAVTDFLVSKTSLKPKGMVGTMFARQLVEIALANLVINPVSNKVTGATPKAKGQGRGGGQGGGGGSSRSSGAGGARASGARSGMGRRR